MTQQQARVSKISIGRLFNLGNFEHVRELAKYCVGCGQCAAKCPAGLSGPSVAAGAIEVLNIERMYARHAERERRRLERMTSEHGESK